MERSFVIIKPDGTARRRVSALILKALMDRGYKIRAFREMKVSESLAKLHYAVHKEKPFFPWLVDFISSAPVLVMIFEADDVIQGVRDALGATFVQKADPISLRGKYGIWAGVNIAHASDAPETATKEIELWTGEGGLEESSDAEEQAKAYIEQYDSGDVDYTMEIRDVVKNAIENHDISDNVLESLVRFLGKDSKDITHEEITALASVIFDFVKEEVEKA
ncbi:MAG: Nucleoside diphosphate kinase [Candidatus Thorarchaeota archaeon AB_25]|nr:MAG: Nucleoside diphosphate kinase [Candidatus Thorarchaeota archaeon AB_25]